MADTFTFTLDEETEKRLFDLLTDVDVSNTPSFTIKDKHGNEAEYVKAVRCKDCVHYQKWIKGMYCTVHDWYTKKTDYCSRAERKTE